MIYLIEIIVTTPYGIVIFFVNGVIVAVSNVVYDVLVIAWMEIIYRMDMEILRGQSNPKHHLTV